ncbi:tRNA N(3)-methylcytidine methyltransferase METTL6 isoform X2 [Capsicum annuum]|uniref:tRNA N(3)-methylcytidine methyltransferase METTL6 isoform X2 n=1 Tax=Capsicum annuum TaxID=4072 RepID=UPI0007BEF4DA|nr:tRNA N(3)-methylcytidine methyltransferase METTL6 isoform X2 [Capsicum annuum]
MVVQLWQYYGLSGFISLLRQADIVVHLLIDNFNVLCEESQPCYSDLIAETFAYLFSGNKSISLYACDCSKEALERAKENIEAANINLAKERFYPFQCDFSASRFPNWLACTACRENFFQKQSMCISDARSCSKQDFPSAKNNSCIGGVDFVTLIFTLSAVPLHRMSRAITECFSVLKPGGLLLFRDYGLYDMTMLRFEPEQRVGYREYMRSDGTRSYFFCLDRVRDLFCATGFTELELEYCCVQSVNRQNGKIMQRVWIHGKFQRPHVHVGS